VYLRLVAPSYKFANDARTNRQGMMLVLGVAAIGLVETMIAVAIQKYVWHKKTLCDPNNDFLKDPAPNT